MAREENTNNNSRIQKLKDWWQSDTAKAVSTIIAVLLIPAAVLAWNYASSRNLNADDNNNNILMDGSSTADKSVTDQNTMDGIEVTVTPTETNTDQANSAVTPSPTPTGMPSVTPTPAAGGINAVNRLPNTSSATDYTVQNRDNVYAISMKICGDNSFYVKHNKQNNLKVGQVISIDCN